MASFKKVCVIGMGLMGGSLAKALREKGIEIVSDDQADITIIATPLSTIIPVAKELRAPLIMDIGSLKREIAEEFERLTTETQEFIATHPMAGSEKSGFENSSGTMFVGAPWIITPHSKNSKKGLSSIKILIELLDAHAMTMGAEEHDRRIALISQLPHKLSVMLLEFVRRVDPIALEMAGPGFKSMTRLAADNPQMREEMRMMNEEEFEKCVQEFYAYYTLTN